MPRGERADLANAASGNAVVHLPRQMDPGQRQRLQASLDRVPIALGLAAGHASVALPVGLGPRLARRQLEALRREWHRLTDASIDRAITDAERTS